MGRGKDLDIQLSGELENRSPNIQLNRVVHSVLELVDEKQTILGIDERQHNAEEAIQPVAEGTERNRPRDVVRSHDGGSRLPWAFAADHGHCGNPRVNDTQGIDYVLLTVR